MDIDPVKQGTGYPVQVFLYGSRRAVASSRRMVIVAAGTGIHGGYQHKTCRVIYSVFCAGYPDPSFFQRLSQHFQHGAPDFGEFVQEQNTVVCQGYFAWLRSEEQPSELQSLM